MSYDPRFSTDISDITRNNVVNVESVNVFDDIRVGNIVSLQSGTTYIFSKSVNTGLIQFELPVGGSVEFTSDSVLFNNIIPELTGTTPLFSGGAGQIALRNMRIEFTNNGGNLFNITGATQLVPGVILQDAQLIGGNSLGVIEDALTVMLNSAIGGWNSGIYFADNGLGGPRGLVINTVSFGGIGGTHMSICGEQSIINIQNCISIPFNSEGFLNLDPTLVMMSDNEAIIISNNFVDSSLGGVFLAAGSLDGSDVGIVFTGNKEASDSSWVGEVGFEANATNTIISTVDTYTDITGTMVSGKLERFTQASGVITYTGLDTITSEVSVGLSVQNASNNASRDIRVVVIVNGVVKASKSMTITGRTFAISLEDIIVDVETGDEVKAQIKNETNTDNLLVIDYKLTVKKV